MRPIVRTVHNLALLSVIVATCRAANGTAPSKDQVEFFGTEIRPLLSKRCYECHGAGKDPKSGLRLTSRDAVMTGGERGPATVPGKVEESLMIKAVRYHELEMPPQGKLPAD